MTTFSSLEILLQITTFLFFILRSKSLRHFQSRSLNLDQPFHILDPVSCIFYQLEQSFVFLFQQTISIFEMLIFLKYPRVYDLELNSTVMVLELTSWKSQFTNFFAVNKLEFTVIFQMIRQIFPYESSLTLGIVHTLCFRLWAFVVMMVDQLSFRQFHFAKLTFQSNLLAVQEMSLQIILEYIVTAVLANFKSESALYILVLHDIFSDYPLRAS